MIVFNGKQYAANDNEFTDSLMHEHDEVRKLKALFIN